jgi:polysaccharide pyruvyl transferase WcaK-like protein
MTGSLGSRSHAESAAAPRVGIFGNHGMQNIGNDASLEAMLRYLSEELPDARVNSMCSGPEVVRSRFGIAAVPMNWSQKFGARSRLEMAALKALSKGVDVLRIAAWVRSQDVIIVPGMGVLETSLWFRASGFPFTFFLVTAWGRVFRKKVALVCVGATPTKQPIIRWLYNRVARLAYYRSYRDDESREFMRQRGIDTTRDSVYTDLVFSLPVGAQADGDDRLVCVGVMDYRGSGEDRAIAADLHRAYVTDMARFIGWLIDGGRRVRLVIGDANGSDDSALAEIVAEVRAAAPDLAPGCLETPSVTTFADVVDAMQSAGTVVAMRYHNVVAALMLAKPTLAIGYSHKQASLMADAGLGEYSVPARDLDLGELTRKFTELEAQAPRLRTTLSQYRVTTEKLLSQQFTQLSAVLFGQD